MSISQIAALSENFAIGKDNQLLWHFSEDLKYFKAMTQNKVMLMGRKTFASFPKPLPGRHHVVISRSADQQKHESNFVHFVDSIDSGIERAESLIREYSLDPEIMICGGAEIYRATLGRCDFLYLTRIKEQYNADAFYPSEFLNQFTLVLQRKSEQHPEQLVYETWSRAQTVAKT